MITASPVGIQGVRITTLLQQGNYAPDIRPADCLEQCHGQVLLPGMGAEITVFGILHGLFLVFDVFGMRMDGPNNQGQLG